MEYQKDHPDSSLTYITMSTNPYYARYFIIFGFFSLLCILITTPFFIWTNIYTFSTVIVGGVLLSRVLLEFPYTFKEGKVTFSEQGILFETDKSTRFTTLSKLKSMRLDKKRYNICTLYTDPSKYQTHLLIRDEDEHHKIKEWINQHQHLLNSEKE